MRKRLIEICALGLLMSACSATSSTSQTGNSTPPPGVGGMTMPSAASPMIGTPDPGGFAFGMPGEPTQATQVVKVGLFDTLRFDPTLVRVREGETVTFEIRNYGKTNHEFVLGDKTYQRQHEAAMVGMAGAGPPDEPNSVTVQPGFIKTIVWTFTSPGRVIFGCHEPGHFAGGMKGMVVVSPTR